jgi:hypothetical protein
VTAGQNRHGALLKIDTAKQKFYKYNKTKSILITKQNKKNKKTKKIPGYPSGQRGMI